MTDHPHEMWEVRYRSEPHYLFGTTPAQFLSDNPWLIMPGARVLCVSDGEGRNGVYLAQAGMHVTSFDPSLTAVSRARALAAEHGVTMDAHVAEWNDWDWERQFDLVVGIFIQWADPVFRVRQFADMTRTLISGGRLALHGYGVDQIAHGTGGPREVAQLYTETLLRDAFAGWRVERCAAYERDVQEGPTHSGRSALVDFVARRPNG